MQLLTRPKSISSTDRLGSSLVQLGTELPIFSCMLMQSYCIVIVVTGDIDLARDLATTLSNAVIFGNTVYVSFFGLGLDIKY